MWWRIGTRSLAAILWLSILCACAAGGQPPEVTAASAVLVDADTGALLYSKAGREARPVASTTKVMTALLAVENCDLSDEVTVSRSVLSVTGSNVGLQPGDVLLMDDLLSSLLLASGNDAAVVVAEHISGSVEAFADLMTARAAQLGATNTHFTNPHGLYDPEHRSSAYDLALIAAEALHHPRIAELAGSKVAEVALPSSPEGVVRLINHNKLLWQADFVDGVKTGYVRQSGPCLIASGSRDGWRLIAVILDGPDRYREARALLEYGFDSFRREVYAKAGDAVGRVRVRGGVQSHVPAVCEETLATVAAPGAERDCRLAVTMEQPLRAPVAAGAPVGEAQLVCEGEVIARSALVASGEVPRSWLKVAGMWFLRSVVALPLFVFATRTYGKAVKAHRRRRRRLPAEGRGPDPGGPSAR